MTDRKGVLMDDRRTWAEAAFWFVFGAVILCASLLAVAQNDAGQDYCVATIERHMDGIPGTPEWLSFCVPAGEQVDVLEPTLTNQGNAHFRWAAGSAACLYTTDPHGHFPGGGRDLEPRNPAGRYYVGEINAGYQAWVKAPGNCAQFGIGYCPTAFICGDEVTPGQEGVY